MELWRVYKGKTIRPLCITSSRLFGCTPTFVNTSASWSLVATQAKSTLSFFLASWRKWTSALRRFSETFPLDEIATNRSRLSIKHLIGMEFDIALRSNISEINCRTKVAESKASRSASASAARVLRTTLFSRFEFQQIGDRFSASSARKTMNPPWLPPFFTFPKDASLNTSM